MLDVDLFPLAINPIGALLQPGLHVGDLVCPSGLRLSVEHAVEIRSGQDLIIRGSMPIEKWCTRDLQDTRFPAPSRLHDVP